MPSIKNYISRKLSPPKSPEGFPGASNSFPTTIIAIDEKAPPPRRLIELSMQAIRVALDEINLDDIQARPTAPDWFTIWPGEHYRLMAALVKVMQPKVIVEVGTDTGLSSLCMKKYLPADGKVVTFDLIPWQKVQRGPALLQEDFADGRLEQRLADLGDPATFDKHRDLIASAELFFIDGPKNIQFETSFMRLLETVTFERPPVMIFDDTRLPSMLKFWRELAYPKLDLTSFAHWSGTGMVELVR